MVSSDKTADHKVSSDKLLQRPSSHSDITVSQETCDNEIDSSKPDGARSIPSDVAKKEVPDSDATASAPPLDQERSACTSPPQKPSQSPNTVQHALQSGQERSSIICEKGSKDIVAEKEVLDSDATAYAVKLDQQGSTFSSSHEKSPQNPNTAPHSVQAGQGSPFTISGKVSKGGFNWRKYGQKHVKGNEFIRSYYKCTHPNCQAKKQLEQSNDGQITDTIFIGQHNHPQVNTPVPVDGVVTVVEQRPDVPSLVNVEDKASIEHGYVPQHIKPLEALPISTLSASNESKAVHLQSTRMRNAVPANEDPESKRLKKDNSNADVTGVERSIGESRVVVHSSSEVDFINDGYRWRKYGQKLVKGNPNPRSYYRCSNSGCPVKKHVERASHDPKIVITTYEGHHDHDSPFGRTVNHNGGAMTPATNVNGDSGTKSQGNSVCVNTTEPTCLDSECRLNEQPNGEKIAKPNSGDMVESQAITLPSQVLGNTSSEKEKNGNSGTQKDSVSVDLISSTDSEHPCRLNEQQKDEVRTISEESKNESKLNKRLEPDADRTCPKLNLQCSSKLS